MENQSVGDIDSDEMIECIVGCEPAKFTTSIFVQIEDAIQCARDFFDTQKRSSCIEWEAMWME